MRYLAKLSSVVERRAECPFLIDSLQERTLSFREFHDHAWGVGQRLRREGIRRGNRVVLLLPNCSELAVLYFSCLYLGAVAVPVNPIVHRRDVAFMIEHSGARLVLCAESLRDRVDERLLASCGVQLLFLRLGHEKGGGPVSLDLQEHARPETNGGAWEPLLGVSSEDLISITYTSGTTGRPKGVAHRNRNMIGNAERFCTAVGIDNDHRFYNVLPMTYIAGFYNLLILPFIAGASVVVTRGFEEHSITRFWQTAMRWECNTLWLVPSILAILLKLDRGKDGEAFCHSALRLALVGTAPLVGQLRREFETRYGIVLHESYGLSETLLVTTSSPRRLASAGTVGPVLPGVELALMNGKGQRASAGDEGEILIKSPDLMAGYVQTAMDAGQHSLNLSAAIDPDGWFATGDIGRLNPDGSLAITGRKKDLIIRGGINVSPRAIEEVLQTHEAVCEAAVIGIPHEIYGEDIAAVVRLEAGYSLSGVQPSLRTFCKEHLNPTQQPGVFLEIDQFPLSPTGKVQKAKLRDLVFKQLRLLRPTPAVVQSHTVQLEPGRPAVIVRRRIQRPAPELLLKFQALRLSTLAACAPAVRVLDSRLVPLVPGRSLCGPCVTVEDQEGGALITLAAIEVIEPGDVLLVKGLENGERSSWGIVQTRAAKLRGAGGVVVLGRVADTAELRWQGLATFALGVSTSPCAEGSGGTVNLPVACCGEPVLPGDIIVGNEDGVLVIPAGTAQDVLAQAQRLSDREQRSLFQLEGGSSALDATGARPRFLQLSGEFE